MRLFGAIGAVCLVGLACGAHGAQRAETRPDTPGSKEAVSYGTPLCGRLAGGVPFPCHGRNFLPFSKATCEQRRNVLHPRLVKTVLSAYERLGARTPGREWQYGDMGKEGGGRLAPHRAHQNGLSVDFYMPLLDAAGAPTKMPASATEKYAGKLDFDRSGRLGELRIDFEAAAAHLLALEAAAKENGLAIELIIVTPDFHSKLWAADPAMERLKPVFFKREAGARHDEHYHVDFQLPPSERRPFRCR